MKRTGFTFIEILIYMGLMTVLFTVLGTIFLQILDMQQESESTSFMEANGRYVLSRLAYDIRRASAVTAPALGVTSPSLALVVGGTTYTYAVNGDHLDLTVNAVTDQLTSYGTQISNFSVTQLGTVSGKNTLKVSFDITSGTETQNYSTTVGRR